MADITTSTGQVIPDRPAWMASLPNMSDQAPSPAPTDTLHSNSFLSGVGKGLFGLSGSLGSLTQAAGTLAGSDTVAQAGKSFAAQEAAKAAGYDRPDLAAKPWYDPSRLINTIGEAVPGTAAAVAGAFATAGAAPVAEGTGALSRFLAGGGLGAAGATFPQVVGSNVEAAEGANNGELSRENAAKAIGLGVPEAALGAVMPTRLESILEHGAEGKLATRLFTGGATVGAFGGIQSAVQTGVTQQAFTPDMPIGERSRQIVDSFFSGALQGGVFGATLSGLRKTRPNMSNADMENEIAATDPAQPAPKPPQLEGPTTPKQLTYQPQAQQPIELKGPFAQTPNDELTAQADAMTAKGSAKSTEEDQQHTAMLEELLRRTPPGSTPADGNLRTPEEMASLAPAIAEMKSNLIENNPRIPKNDSLLQDFNASSVPETVNAIRDRLSQTDGKPPAWLEDVANDYGLMNGSKIVSPAERLVDLQNQQDTAMQARDDAVKAGDKVGFRAASKKLSNVVDQIATVRPQLDLHDQADALLPSRPEPLPTPAVDATGQSNLPGLGLASPVERTAGVNVTPEGAVSGQRSFFTPEETGERAAARVKFQDSLLAQLTPAKAARAEPIIRSLDATNDAEMVNALRKHVADSEENAGGSLAPAFKQLADIYGVTDRNGSSRDLDAEHTGLTKQYDSLLDQASKTNGDGQKAILIKRATDLRNGPIAKSEELLDAHAAADRLGTSPEPVPQRVPDRYADMWRTLDAMKDSTDPATVARSDNAKKALEQNNPAGQQIAAGVIARFAKDQRPSVTTKIGAKDAVQEPSAKGMDAQKPSRDGGGVGEGNSGRQAAGSRAEEGAGPETTGKRQSQTEARTHWEEAVADLGTNIPPLETKAKTRVKMTAAEKAAAKASDDLGVKKSESMSSIGEREIESMKRGDDAGVPSWVTPHALDLQGDVVYHDDKSALVRGFNNLGDSVFVPVDRATGLRGTKDISTSNVSFLDPVTKSKLTAAKNEFVARDKAASALFPDGPFQGAQRSVVGTQHADPRVVSYVQGLMDQLGLSKVRVLIAHPDDVQGSRGDASGLHGEYEAARTAGMNAGDLGNMRQFGPGNKDFYIYVKPGQSDAATIETTAHEVGHIVQRTALANAPASTKLALMLAHGEFLKSTQGLSGEDLLRATRNRTIATDAIDNFEGHGMAASHAAYLKSFNEWFADNTSKWATTAEKPRSLVEKFFSAVAQKMRQFISAVTGNRFLPNSQVADFLNRMPPDSDASWFRNRGEGQEKVPESEALGETEPRQIDSLARDSIQRVESAARDAIGENLINGRASVRKMLGGWVPSSQFAAIWAKELPAGLKYVNHSQQKVAIESAKNKTTLEAFRPMYNLAPEARDLVHQHVANMQGSGGLNPELPFKDQPQAASPDKAAWEKRYNELRAERSRIQQAGATPAMKSLLQAHQLNGYQEIVAHLQAAGEHFFRQEGVQLPGHGVNRDTSFQMMSTAHDKPELALQQYKSWATEMQQGVKSQIDGMTKQIDTLKVSGDKKAALAATDTVQQLKQVARYIDQRMESVGSGTYVPLDHGQGDRFVSAKAVADKNGNISEKTAQAIQNRLDKEGFKVGIFHDVGNNSIFMRVKTDAQMARLASVMKELQGTGHIDKSEEVKNGHVDTFNEKAAPKYLQMQIAHVDDVLKSLPDGVDAATKDNIRKGLVSQLIDSSPDHSLLRSLSARDNVSGYNRDMTEASSIRARNSARASTGISMSGRMADIMGEMRQQVQAAKDDPNLAPADRTKPQDVANEFMTREAQQSWRVSNKAVDALQAGMHSIMIGANPAYTLTALSQVPLLLHPELAKTHGFAPAALSIGRNAKPAFDAMRAIFGGKDGWSSGVRDRDLQTTSLSKKQIADIMTADNRGYLSNSSFTRGVTDLGDGADPTAVKFKDRANALGSYAELYPRILSVLSAAEMYDKKPIKGISRDDFIQKVTQGSQFNYGAGEQPRQLGKKGGLMGGLTPITLAFQSFHVRMVTKYYQEMHAILGKEGPQAQKEAGMWLASHAAGVIAIAGTLGLPGVNFATGITDKLLQELTGRDDIDTQGLYRTWLAHVFTPAIGDMIAKGAPRGIGGFDLSKLGDANLVPFTDIVTDKRKLEDSYKDWLKNMAGSAPATILNTMLGMRDISNGDVLLGASKILPEGFKGLGEAYYMSQHGYVDKNGTPYPVQPSGADIAKAALGLDPTNLAQYNEAKRIEQGLNAQKQYRQQNIDRHLTLAIQNHDPVATTKWVREATEFAREHPGEGNPLGNLQSDLKSRIVAGAMAKSYNTPIGVGPLSSIRRSVGFIDTGDK